MSDENRITYDGLLKEARENIDEYLDDLDDQERADVFEKDEPHDAIFECADGTVPIYTATLMGLAADNIELATAEPDIGPAFDGSPTPVNIVAANVFEAISAEMCERYRERRGEWEDEQIDAELEDAQ